MVDTMYYDSFAEEYVLKPDPYAPPERYVMTVRGTPGIYIDHWGGEHNGISGCALDIAYATDEYYSEVHDMRYRSMCEEHGFKATHLRYFTLPEEKFDEYVERFGLDEESQKGAEEQDESH